jgi:hypothetical protein
MEIFPPNHPRDLPENVDLISAQGGVRPPIFRILPRILPLYPKRLGGIAEGNAGVRSCCTTPASDGMLLAARSAKVECEESGELRQRSADALCQRHDSSGQEDIEQSQRQKHLPAQHHQLVVAETGDGPTYPDEQEQEDGDFAGKGEDLQDAEPPR